MRVSVEVYRIVVVIDVMFEKVNSKMIVLTTFGIPVVVTVVITSIGFTAGAFAGTRITSAARTTQAITRTLTTSRLFKSVPHRCWV